ncbi:MBL fold metallo-hydrolase [Paracoccus seriniphilus]|uniref:Ribonuclease BN, tRNA processing enzyme n=1 Tax=Paracoccus seriniphilus TaxID=184748 RepID=A0A239Q3E3_9RHOB|nr:MBL fold metallo-hydrolase [Paracoccus seriniphilus]WCR15574.1 MBL fold metallo-hydrolase [Paracoccus seriniphilus]SNT76733.1 Ribonuclease BN, tRNA processing enzyme [Paracoccus seriniphilus]
MKFTILGSGTPAPSLRRMSSGYALEVGNDLLVFDHGAGAHQRFLEAGLKAADVTHCFLTHYHYDHIMDLPRLVLTRWDHGQPGANPLKIFGPDPLTQLLDRFFGENGAFAWDINARIDSPASQAVYRVRGGILPRPGPSLTPRQVTVGDVIEGDGWRVIVGPARHVQPVLDCIAYRIETPEVTIVYSGDNGGIYEPFIEFAKGADILIHMNHFLSGTEADQDYRIMSGSHLDNAETAKRAGVGTLVLTHLQPNFDRPGVTEKMLAEISEIYGGTVIVAQDAMDLPLQPACNELAD